MIAMIKRMKMFYGLIGPRLLVLLFSMQLAALIEAFGISLMLPVIQGGSESNSQLEQIIDWAFNLVNVTPTLTNSLIALTVFFLIRSVILVAQSWFTAKILSQTLMTMRSDFIGSLARSKYSHIRTVDIGTASNVMGAEIERVNAALNQLLLLMVAATTAIVYVGIALLVAPVVTLFLLLLAVPIALVMIFVNKSTSRASNKYTAGSNKQLSLMFEMLSAIKYLSATGRSPKILRRIVAESTKVGNAYRKLHYYRGATLFGLEPFIVVALAAVIYFLVEVRNGDILDILFLLFVFRTAAVSIVATQPTYRKFIDTTGSLKVYNDLRTNFDQHSQPDTSRLIEPDFSGDLKLDNVSYRYDDGSEDVLKNIGISIPPRSTVALVGPSGSGKSTLANLLISLIEPTGGTISLANTPYGDIDAAKLRSNVGYVTQESVVFNSTIEDNITLWTKPVDTKKLAKIIKSTNLEDLIARTSESNAEDSEHTIQGLSGGERQRVSIARELYWDSELLVLDEATSSMDSLLEKQINILMSTLQGEKTMIVIAHRLSTVKSADKIIVLQNGSVVEQGSFEELTAADGLFTQMVKQQTL
jgi:ABC-type bacteriocin/lantibiotic exporter with double-glycine peptidase domain